MKRLFSLLIIFIIPLNLLCQIIEKEFVVRSRYLNFPVSMRQGRQLVKFLAGKDTLTHSVIRIADGEPDYWVFKDVSAYSGKKVRLLFSAKVKGIDMIYQSDKFAGQDSLYLERYRPGFHFTTRRGWNNDPNGLVWHNGEYHLFYQHNPYETQWENMHWGHAVSKDLIHWEELNDALYPDALGSMFSGSAVVDANNTSGWGKDVLVAIYTTAGKKQVQCIAYSKDNGRTFIKYDGNPVAGPTRDPKVIWYEPDRQWVMALYKEAGISFFTSRDLKSWEEQSHLNGFYECPELFELVGDGDPLKKKWIVYSGSGTYMIGKFDGKKFTPEYGKYRNTFGAQYAAQTYNNAPDGRRIQIGWGRIEHPGMPFNQMMCFPTELSLRTTKEGLRLFSEPLTEVSALHKNKLDLSGMGLAEINEKLGSVRSDLLHIRMVIESVDGSGLTINYKGNRYVTMDADEINGVQVPLDDPGSIVFEAELLIDKTSIESYFQKGRTVFVSALKKPVKSQGLELTGNPGSLKIHKMEVWEMDPIWQSK